MQFYLMKRMVSDIGLTSSVSVDIKPGTFWIKEKPQSKVLSYFQCHPTPKKGNKSRHLQSDNKK